MPSGNTSTTLQALAERFDHPSVRVMARELTHLAREFERGVRFWPARAALPGQADRGLPQLESIQTALKQRQWPRQRAVDQESWQDFAAVVWSILAASPEAVPAPKANEPHPAAVIALRLVWGAERFAELPTVVLKPPPAPFLTSLAQLLAPASKIQPAELDTSVADWLEGIRSALDVQGTGLPVEEVRGFAGVVGACRVVGQLRAEISLEDMAAGYLAWARLLRANLGQLVNIASGWWTAQASKGEHPS